MQTLIDEKDSIIEVLREELRRKNKHFSQFIEKQKSLEQKIQKLEDILFYDDKYGEQESSVFKTEGNDEDLDKELMDQIYQKINSDDESEDQKKKKDEDEYDVTRVYLNQNVSESTVQDCIQLVPEYL